MDQSNGTRHEPARLSAARPKRGINSRARRPVICGIDVLANTAEICQRMRALSIGNLEGKNTNEQLHAQARTCGVEVTGNGQLLRHGIADDIDDSLHELLETQKARAAAFTQEQADPEASKIERAKKEARARELEAEAARIRADA